MQTSLKANGKPRIPAPINEIIILANTFEVLDVPTSPSSAVKVILHDLLSSLITTIKIILINIT